MKINSERDIAAYGIQVTLMRVDKIRVVVSNGENTTTLIEKKEVVVHTRMIQNFMDKICPEGET